MPNKYQYIIAGAGSSGLSLAWHLIHSELDIKNILVIDQNLTPKNDKTWCFWMRGIPYFSNLIHKRWDQSDIFINGDHHQEQLSQFPYYAIQSGTFRTAILNELKSCPHITLLESPIHRIHGNNSIATLRCKHGSFEAEYIFQSCFTPSYKNRPRYPLTQHFLGWDITANSRVFNPDSFTLMDIDDSYSNGIAFMYMLPWSSTKALLEYTIFSENLEPASFYEEKIELYLFNKFGLKRLDYGIERVEYGQIPMEDSTYYSWYAPRVLNLGRNAGLTKPSTGYTFRGIQEHSRTIVDHLIEDGKPASPPRSNLRFRNYDLWLLQIMYAHPQDGIQVFQNLFKNNSLDDIFRFLGEESNFKQDLSIMTSVPWRPFLKAIWETKLRI